MPYKRNDPGHCFLKNLIFRVRKAVAHHNPLQSTDSSAGKADLPWGPRAEHAGFAERQENIQMWMKLNLKERICPARSMRSVANFSLLFYSTVGPLHFHHSQVQHLTHPRSHHSPQKNTNINIMQMWHMQISPSKYETPSRN